MELDRKIDNHGTCQILPHDNETEIDFPNYNVI